MTSRELVYRTLAFENTRHRAPRDLWTLPWARTHDPEGLARIQRDFTWDLSSPQTVYRTPGIAKGDPYAVGEYRDDWGCVFVNIHSGIIGEVKQPLIQGPDWEDADKAHVPEEWLDFAAAAVNRACAAPARVRLAPACPRPFEQLQVLRGTVQLYMDLMDLGAGFRAFLNRMHDFYCRLLQAWAKTDVDALRFMDDWGAQRGLLISPKLWSEVFQPLYQDYIDIAHSHGKRIFMHSDGDTSAILPILADMGLDAVNAQLFCIGVEKLAPLRGRLTFWGEIDRQHLLPEGTPAEIDAAVQKVYETLWKDGGCIAQCEYGPGGRAENVYQVYKSWDRLTGGRA